MSAVEFVVFAAAIATSVLQLKEIGFALAVAVLLDATTIRLEGEVSWFVVQRSFADPLRPPLVAR